jgi:Periplasmic copper-binding protein (NosD)
MARELRLLGILGVVLASVVAASVAAPAAALASVSCSLYASPVGSDAANGSLAGPFRSAQKLVDSLAAGQTGCLRGGSYGQSELRFNHGGAAGAPVTLASYPGETATLTGGFVYVPSGSDFVTLENLHIDTSAASQVGVQLMAAHSSLIGDDVTNGSTGHSCIILGSNAGWGRAVASVIEGDVIHQCGSVADGNQDHAIYFDNSVNGVVRGDVIWGTSAYAIHLYQNAQGTQITHNVIVDNGYGVIFAGSGTLSSDDNVVANNIIADSVSGYDVESYWGGTVGTGNLLQNNCLYSGHLGQITTVQTGFAASGNVTADPGFVNAAAHDYQLNPGSPCRSVLGRGTTAKRGVTNPTATIARLKPRLVARRAQKSVAHGRRTSHRRGGRAQRSYWLDTLALQLS